MKQFLTHISAIILAAGQSSRMNDFKPLMPVNRMTMIEKVVALFKSCGISDVVVVTGHNRQLLEPVVERTGARSVFNPDFASGMLGSIQKGIKNIRADSCGFFLLPVDIPAVRDSSIELIMNRFFMNHDHLIMPYFNGMPGYPPLIPKQMKPPILGLGNGARLSDFFMSCDIRKVKVNLHDRGILMDADDQKGYEKICRKSCSIDIPDKEECLSIVNTCLPEDDRIRQHLANVAFTALKIANAVKEDVNTNLVVAASLLHDIKRKDKNHARSGARVVRKAGFFRVSDIIAHHMDIDIDLHSSGVTEKEIVYFADKICNGTGIDLNYRKRFSKSLTQSPWAMTRISGRYENTWQIQNRIEASAQKPIKQILA